MHLSILKKLSRLTVIYYISIFLLSLFWSAPSFALDTAKFEIQSSSHLGYKYNLYSPISKAASKSTITQKPTPKPLIVLFHGCGQTTEELLGGSGLLSKALKHDFNILTLKQNKMYNQNECWNWFLESNQTRDGLGFTELEALKDIIKDIGSSPKVNPKRVYLMGISAGAGISANLAFCYPELITGVALHSGAPYKALEISLFSIPSLDEISQVLEETGPEKSAEELGQLAYKCASPKPSDIQLKNIMIFHGTEDKRIIPLHSEILNQQFTDFFLHSYKQAKQDIGPIFTKSTHYKSTKNIYAYDIQETSFKKHNVVIKNYIIETLAHKWSGGDDQYRYNDPNGPSVTNAIIEEFF